MYTVHTAVYGVHMTDANTPDRIVAAALAIVTDEGADAVTMRRVAADAGLTTMATYRHFPNRAALLQTAAESVSTDLGKNWNTGGATDVEEKVLVLLDQYLDFALGSPHLYSFVMTERRADARRFPEDFRDHASPAFTPLLEVIEEGMSEGTLRPDDDALEAAMSVNASAAGLIQLYLSGRIGCSEEEFRQLCVRAVRRVFRGLRA